MRGFVAWLVGLVGSGAGPAGVSAEALRLAGPDIGGGLGIALLLWVVFPIPGFALLFLLAGRFPGLSPWLAGLLLAGSGHLLTDLLWGTNFHATIGDGVRMAFLYGPLFVSGLLGVKARRLMAAR